MKMNFEGEGVGEVLYKPTPLNPLWIRPCLASANPFEEAEVTLFKLSRNISQSTDSTSRSTVSWVWARKMVLNGDLRLFHFTLTFL